MSRSRQISASAVLTVCLIATLGAPAGVAHGEGYYKVQPLYIPYPQPNKPWPMRSAGPTGLSIDLVPPQFTIRISEIAKGSPAQATGKLKKGQIIETINGQVPEDIDPRVWLANLIGEAEATDGLMRLKIRGESEPVELKLPVLGRYADTWPIDCPKSDRIVRNLADVLAKQDGPRWGSVLFLLSTGEEKDLQVVKRWMKDYNGTNRYPWFNGMEGMGVCEYYLRTGDQRMLPVIKGMTEHLKEQVYNGGWSGRGKASFTYVGGGQLGAAGVPCLTFLLLARQCGVDVDEDTLLSSLRHFFRFAGRGNVAYGDHMPEGGFRDNGKTAILSIAMGAAAQLTPDPESSIYAGARDNSAMKSFYASSWFNRAHTGGGIGEMWHANAMQLMREKRPLQWRTFMDERRWHFELSRRYDGSIGIHDGGRYDKSATEHSRSWGTIHALVYTAHRKKLRLFGAPPTRWSTKYDLPKRPWGTPADDVFQSLIAAEHAPGQRQDITDETLAHDASAVWASRLSSDTPEQLWVKLHHPEYAYRVGTMRAVVRGGHDALVVRALKSDDPRVRQVGIEAIAGMFKGSPLPNDRITDEMWELIGRMLQDPDESWFVARTAMQALARAPRRHVEPHVDRLVQFLGHDDWWMHSTAMGALTQLAADDRHAPKILPAVADVVSSQYAFNSTTRAQKVANQVRNASPAVKQLALEEFGQAYLDLPETIVWPGGQITPNQTEVIHGRALSFLNAVPGSADYMLNLPKLTSTWQATRRDGDKYRYSPRFVPNPRVMGKWKLIAQTGSPEGFEYDKKKMPSGPPFKSIEFRDNGKTDSASRLWSGTTMIDLARNEALQMTFAKAEVPPKGPTIKPPKDAGGIVLDPDEADPNATFEQFLFIEAGGFGGSKDRDWKCGWFVLQRVE